MAVRESIKKRKNMKLAEKNREWQSLPMIYRMQKQYGDFKKEASKIQEKLKRKAYSNRKKDYVSPFQLLALSKKMSKRSSLFKKKFGIKTGTRGGVFPLFSSFLPAS